MRDAGNAEAISNEVDFRIFDYSDENDEDAFRALYRTKLAICGLGE